MSMFWRRRIQNSTLTKPQYFHKFFTQKIDNFLGKSKLNFLGQKMNQENSFILTFQQFWKQSIQTWDIAPADKTFCQILLLLIMADRFRDKLLFSKSLVPKLEMKQSFIVLTSLSSCCTTLWKLTLLFLLFKIFQYLFCFIEYSLRFVASKGREFYS